jgi:Cu+-exporting ATPase
MKKIDLFPDTNFGNNEKDGIGNRKECLNEIKEEDGCGCCSGPDLSFLKTPSSQSTNSKAEQLFLEEQEKDREKKEKKKDKNDKILILIGLALTIPLVTIELLEFYNVAGIDVISTDYILLALATPIQVLLGAPFYRRFFGSIKRRSGFTVDTLVVLSTTVAYAYSIVAMLTNQDIRFFEASASVLTIFTIGEYVESKALGTTTESIKKLLALKPKTTVRISRGDVMKQQQQEEVVNVNDLVTGDVFIVKPGENIATDGIIVYGNSSVDESMITGESIPVDKGEGDRVIGGTMNKNGYLHIKATSVGSQTVLANIIEMVVKARASKPSIQRIADRCAKYFIPAVLAIAFISSLYWLLVGQFPIQFAVTVFATVLVVSCPCALGIATPMVVSLGVGNAAKHGVLIKGGKYLEKLASVDTIVFDKTGTLTKGTPEVTDIIPFGSYDETYVLQMASSSENKSEHPIAQAIVKKAHEKGIQLLEVSEFNAITGQGVVAKHKEQRIFVTSPQSANSNYPNSITNEIQSKIYKLETEGKTVVMVFIEDKMIGVIAVADMLRENSLETVKQLQSMGKETILLSGDNKRTANAIAKKIGIKNVLAEVLPEQKAEKIKSLQNEKKRKIVAMVGDGINDAPALTQADVGIAMGSGTDVAMDAGHVILMKNDLSDVVYAFRLAEYSLNKIKQNLTMSFAYNAITISIAAGLFYSMTNSLILTPALGALGWVVSDTLVFGNSLLLRRFHTHK